MPLNLRKCAEPSFIRDRGVFDAVLSVHDEHEKSHYCKGVVIYNFYLSFQNHIIYRKPSVFADSNMRDSAKYSGFFFADFNLVLRSFVTMFTFINSFLF